MLKLMGMDCVIHYRKGKENKAAHYKGEQLRMEQFRLSLE